ncbi:MAG: peptidylprolyl isomerase [Phycisphaerales bacterium JB039]
MARTAEPLFETLESRRLLSVPDSPPSIAVLDDPANPVVRIETDRGRIDIEVFASEAPLAASNFLTLLEAGLPDLSFFHSLFPGETLGGGLYKLVDGQPTVLSQSLFIESATPRSNVERTLAAPLLGGSTDQTDGRWIINLADSPLRDSQFIVFARVIAGWSVVQDIASLTTEDFSTAAPETSGLTSVPVQVTGAPVLTEDVTVDIIDIEQIKPQGLDRYWTQSVVYPEGYAGFDKREVLSVANISDFTVHYEITVRYETGAFRDVVIDTGTLDAGERLQLVLSDDSDAMADLVRPDVPYAIEVRAVADPGPSAVVPPDDVVSATIERSDGFFRFADPLAPDSAAPGGAESFINLAPYNDADLSNWILGPVEGTDSFTLPDGTLRVITRQSFITWMNLAPEDVTVTVTFLGGGSPLAYQFQLDPLRRGGIAAHTELFDRAGVTAFFEGVTVTATGPIAVQFSGFAQILDTPAAGPTNQYRSAFASQALPGAGASTGVLPTIGETVFINPGASVIDITVEVINSDGLIDIFDINAVQPGELVFGPDVTGLAANAVAMRFSATGDVGAFLLDEADGLARVTPFQLNLGNQLHFAGASSPALTDLWELAVYNPWSEASPTAFQVRFSFDDGTQISTTTLAFGTDGFRSLRLDDPELAAVRARIVAGSTLFSMTVFSVDSGGGVGAGAEISAMLLRATAGLDDGSAMIGMTSGSVAPWIPGLML